MSDLGLAGIYDGWAPREEAKALEDVKSDDWRNILVLGRATAGGVYPETLALVGRARYLADQLGCRVEVLLIGKELDAATKALKRYPIDHVYRVSAPDYAPIDHTAKLLEQVVRKRRPELVLVFQSRTGDAVTAYTANRLGVGYVLGASRVDLDTGARQAVVTHDAGIGGFQMVTQMEQSPQFVSVGRGLFRAPMEDEYANVRVFDLDIKTPKLAAIEILERSPPPPASLATAERVVVAGARIETQEELQAARELATRLGAAFGVTIGILERGLAKDEQVVGEQDTLIAPRLLVTVGVRGSLDMLESIQGNPTIAAIGCAKDDPIVERAAYFVAGPVAPAITAVLDAL